VLYEVKPQFERPLAVWDARCSQAAGSHIQWDIPPVVDERRQPQTDFANHLRPQVEGCTGIFPGIKRELGPAIRLIGEDRRHELAMQSGVKDGIATNPEQQ
jgi:hypothetical protein